jgi:hypothetical protein
MAEARRTDPVARTYITKRGRKVHVRITSPSYDLDLRGTGRTTAEAVARVREKVAKRSGGKHLEKGPNP